MRVSFTVNRFFVLINLYLLTHFAHSQKTHSIQLLAIPFTHQIGNMQNMYVKHSESFIYADYIKNSWPEFGLAYRHGFNKKWNLNIGLSFQNATHEMTFQISNIIKYGSSQYFTNAKTTQQNLNLRLGAGYAFNKIIKMNFGVSFNGGIAYKSNFTSTDRIMSAISFPWEPFQHYYLMDIKVNRGNFNTLNIVPEISASFNIVDNLNLLVGFRFKFWNSKIYYYQAAVTGFIGDENKGTTAVLHESNYTSKDYSVYFGLTYDVFLKKKHKIVD